MVTIAPPMTAPDVSCTTPEIVPVFTCENREKENSNTPTAAPNRLIAFPARSIFNTQFIAPPCSNAEDYLHTEKGLRLETSHLGKAPDVWVACNTAQP